MAAAGQGLQSHKLEFSFTLTSLDIQQIKLRPLTNATPNVTVKWTNRLDIASCDLFLFLTNPKKLRGIQFSTSGEAALEEHAKCPRKSELPILRNRFKTMSKCVK